MSRAPAARGRRSLTLMGAVAVIVAAAATTAVAGAPEALHAARQVTTVTAGRTAVAAHPALATAATPAEAPVAGTGDATALYVLSSTTAWGAGPAHLERIARTGTARLSGAPLPGGVDVVRAGDSLWVAAGTVPAVYRIDPRTLAVRRRIALGSAAGAIAATASAVWVGGPGRISRIDPASGAVTAVLPVEGEVTSLAADPSGRHLYSAATGSQGTVVSERDPRTGAVTVSRRVAPGHARLAATPAGVWVWQDGATALDLVRLGAAGLRPAARVTRRLEAYGSYT